MDVLRVDLGSDMDNSKSMGVVMTGELMEHDKAPAKSWLMAKDWTLFQKVRSGDVMEQTFSPDTCVLKCLISGEGDLYKPGDIVEDFFNHEFIVYTMVPQFEVVREDMAEWKEMREGGGYELP
jgi:hypothetical protein